MRHSRASLFFLTCYYSDPSHINDITGLIFSDFRAPRSTSEIKSAKCWVAQSSIVMWFAPMELRLLTITQHCAENDLQFIISLSSSQQLQHETYWLGSNVCTMYLELLKLLPTFMLSDHFELRSTIYLAITPYAELWRKMQRGAICCEYCRRGLCVSRLFPFLKYVFMRSLKSLVSNTEWIKDNSTFPPSLEASSFLLFSRSDEETHSILSSVVASRSVSSVSANLFFAAERPEIKVHLYINPQSCYITGGSDDNSGEQWAHTTHKNTLQQHCSIASSREKHDRRRIMRSILEKLLLSPLLVSADALCLRTKQQEGDRMGRIPGIMCAEEET